MSTDKITFRCGRCGSDKFRLPNANPSTADLVACAGCGVQARYGDLRAEAVRLAKQHVGQALRHTFRGVKGVTFNL